MDKLKRILTCYFAWLFLLLFPASSNGQGLNIKTGAALVNKGNLVLKGDWINDCQFFDTSGTVIFSGTTQTIGGTVPSAFNNLTISSGSSTTVISAGQTLSRILLSNGTLDGGGFLTLLSTASRTALIDGNGTGQVLGNVTMQRYLLSGFGYRYISSPFQAATGNELSPEVNLASGFPLVYRYDENRTSSGWVSHVNPALTLTPLQGYSANFGSVAAPEILDITGLVNNGSVSVTLYNHNYTYTKGLNLVGNPYPSAIDWNAASGWTKTNIDNAIYFFKASGTDQYGGSYSSYVNGVSSDGLVNNIIPSMQGFFIHVSNGAYPVTGTLGMNNSVRINNMSQSFSKSGVKDEPSVIRITTAFASDTSITDLMLVYIDDKASATFDNDYDALKLFNTDLTIPNIYSVSPEDFKLSINALPPLVDSLVRIPLGVKANTAGTIVFRLKTLTGSFTGNTIAIFDSVAGISRILNNQGEYRIYLPVAEYRNRFFLDIDNVTAGTEIPVTSDRMFFAWISGGVLKANIDDLQGNEGVIYLTNLTGQRLLEKKIQETGYHEFGIPVKNGIYFITLVSGNRRTVQKFIISR